MRHDTTELPIALCHPDGERAISRVRIVIHIEQESFQKSGAKGTLPDLLAATKTCHTLPGRNRFAAAD